MRNRNTHILEDINWNKTFCGKMLPNVGAVSCEYYCLFRHKWKEDPFCKKCEQDPRIPLILLSKTDL